MSLRADRRAQSIQIGALLLFAVLIILFATYQAFVVPDQNRGVEANHLETISQQMQELRSAIVSVPGTQTGTSVTLRLGTSYPSRVIGLNPPDPAGAVRTVGTVNESVNLTVSNAVARDGETDDYWDGTNRTYNSGGLAYRPAYNEFRNSPTIVYENSLLYHRFRTGTLTKAGQRLVNGDRLSLVSLNGSLDTATSGSVSVDLEAVSASNRRISVTNEPGENVTVAVASQLNASRWEEELRADGELTDQGGHVAAVTDNDIPGSPFRLVYIHLERGETYVLQLTKVGVGTGIKSESKMYLTDVTGDGTSVEQGKNATLVVEVRDGLNNPIAGVQVNATAESGSITATEITDEAGQASFDYQAPGGSSGEIAVNFSYSVVPGTGFNGSAPANVSMTLTVESPGGSTGSLVYDGNALAHDGPDPNAAPGGVNITVENTHDSTATITDVEIKPADSAIDVLADRLRGSGITRREVYVSADQSDGYVDFSDLNFTDGSVDGTTVPREINLNANGRERNGDPQLSSGATGTMYLYEFFTDTNDASNVNMTGEAVDVTVSYRLPTGRTFQSQFTVTPDFSGSGGGGGGAGFASVTAQNLNANSPGQSQDITFTLQGDLADGETVQVDLSDAQGFTQNGKTRVDYQTSNAAVDSGSGSVQFTTQNTDNAVVTYTAGSGGDTDGSTIEVTILDIDTGPPGQQNGPYDVVFDRSDGGTSTTTFTVN